MELKDFIKQVLADVTNAVRESQQELNNGSVIAPSKTYAISEIAMYKDRTNKVEPSRINFEVAVSVEESKDKKAQVNILSSIVGLGASGGSHDLSKQISRLCFSIPLIYPLPD